MIAEKQFKFPFDLGHLLIRPYEHLGKGIDAEEADRVRTDLVKAIKTLLATPDVDSPVLHVPAAPAGLDPRRCPDRRRGGGGCGAGAPGACGGGR